jgi:hypothetical protein
MDRVDPRRRARLDASRDPDAEGGQSRLGHHPNIVPVYDVGQVTRDTDAGARRAVPLRPGFWRTFGKKGLLLESLGRFAEAVAAYEKAVAIAGDKIPVLKENLARARMRAGAKTK